MTAHPCYLLSLSQELGVCPMDIFCPGLLINQVDCMDSSCESIFLFVSEMLLDYKLEEDLIGLKVQPMSVTICKD